MLQDEYYVIERENNDNYPLFSWDQNSGEIGMGGPVKYDQPIKLALSDSISPSFEWVDYHSLPAPVISSALKNTLNELNLYGIQFIPALVHHAKSGEVKDYWYTNICNRIACLDKSESEIDYSSSGDTIFGIDKLVLKNDVLQQIDLSRRVLFALSEDPTVVVIHQSLKDIIKKTNAKGLRFFDVAEWNSDCAFD